MTNGTVAFLRGKLRKIWPGLPSTRVAWQRSVEGAIRDVARLTLATVLGYLLTVKLLPPPVDLTGALTALLVTQASLRGSFRAGLVRVGAVVSGILVALAVATFVGLHWWSLAVVVFIALLVARVLQLGDAGLESAISAMLILGSVGAEVAAQTRFLTTIIGTIVGIVLPLVLPRRVQTADLTRDLRRIALRLRSVYRDAARYLTVNSPNTQATRQWLDSV
ncbi:MAG: aromatic acid exporter family protein, partial [Propioniciclava sp.]